MKPDMAVNNKFKITIICSFTIYKRFYIYAMTLDITENVKLELISAKHAEGLFEAVDNNREHLSEFLPWVSQMRSVSDFEEYIYNCELLHEQKKEVSFVIRNEYKIVGRIGLNYINIQHKNAAIGYWLIKEAEGIGIITRSCEKLIHLGFTELNLHRIEIKAAVNNLKSQAIPKRLHFKKEGILRGAELVNGEFLDLVLFSLLREEWRG